MKSKPSHDKERIDSEQSQATPLDVDDLFTLLKNERRRIAVRTVAAQGACSLRDLSEAVSAQTDAPAVDERPGEHRHRTRVALHQNHIPKLVDSGVLSESGHNIYDLGSAGPQFLTALDAVETLMEVRNE